MPTTKKQLEFDRQLDLTAIREYRRTKNLRIIDELYQKYALLVYGVCLNHLKKRDLAKEMLVQIFKIVQERIAKADVKHFREWLYELTLQECADFAKISSSENN
ncbi:MAG: hypothetical protein PF436_00220 [Prolixibacteraceae bacterium]|jgi:DNA-directed RNA polymerase specialized sigma24 family protein|nr:hypothetical protein [Prolixibacteraceae bacterium]